MTVEVRLPAYQCTIMFFNYIGSQSPHPERRKLFCKGYNSSDIIRTGLSLKQATEIIVETCVSETN